MSYATGSRLTPRSYAALLVLLPPVFRRRYSEEMRAMFREHLDEARTDGTTAVRVALREHVDLCRTILREWTRTLRPPGRRPDPRDSPSERLLEIMVEILSDVRYAFRTMVRQPVYSTVILFTLAIGIGATSAIYTVVDNVLLRPLALPDADELVLGFGSFPLNDSASVSPPDYLDYREQSESFEALGAYTSFTSGYDVAVEGTPERVSGRLVTANLLEVARVPVIHGRGFLPSEELDGAEPVALLSEGFWRRAYAADPSAVGRSIVLDGEPVTIVGVVADSLRALLTQDVLRPIPFGVPMEEGAGLVTTVRRFHFLRVVGRLAPATSIDSAQDEVDAIAGQLAAEYPDSNTDWTLRLLPLQQAFVGPVRTPLIVLMGAVVAVLLIVCCNVAVILLARATSRAPEMALRVALGGSGTRIVRLVLTESLVFALIGGGLGLLLAQRGLVALLALGGGGLPRVDEIALDGRVVAFGLAVAVTTGLAFGLAPALHTRRRNLATALHGGGRSSAPRAAQRLRGGLVIAQVAIAVTLSVGAGLFLRSLAELQGVDTGFDQAGIVAASLDLPDARYPEPEQRRSFYRALLEGLGAVPGVEAAAAIDILPFTNGSDTWLYPEGRPPEEGSQGFNAQVRMITDGYFETMAIPLVAGRPFDARDHDREAPKVIIDAPVAQAMFPDENAVGRRVVIDFGDPLVAEIVGVAAEIRHFGLGGSNSGAMYFPYWAEPLGGMTVVARAAAGPADVVAGLRARAAELDPQLPLVDVVTMSELVDQSVAQPRFQTVLLGLFAILALGLAAMGLYGVLAYLVNERRREMGIRMALGAAPASVVRYVMRRGLVLVGTGLAIGLLAAVAATRAVSSLLFGISGADPVSWITVLVLLGGIGAAASFLPARRATRVDPVEVLRAE